MYAEEKKIVREYLKSIESSTKENIDDILKCYFDTKNYNFKGIYPHRELHSVEEVAKSFWKPLLSSFTKLHRREDIFFAGENTVNGKNNEGVWVLSMGYFVGLFDREFMGIRPTGKIAHLRYAEFSKVKKGKIVKTGLFVDYIALMEESGVYPLPPSTGHTFVYPGPIEHNGILLNESDPNEGIKTMKLVNEMVEDLTKLTEKDSMTCPPEILEKTWSEDMVWYGPGGIGASFTIPRYQLQHQLPFRSNLKDKTFNGHIARFAEGNFAAFFGWPNLTNVPTGGFLGLPGGNVKADMFVCDIYSRVGDKLMENWVIIDIPYWLKQQGLDIFKRCEEIYNPKY